MLLSSVTWSKARGCQHPSAAAAAAAAKVSDDVTAAIALTIRSASLVSGVC